MGATRKELGTGAPMGATTKDPEVKTPMGAPMSTVTPMGAPGTDPSIGAPMDAAVKDPSVRAPMGASTKDSAPPAPMGATRKDPSTGAPVGATQRPRLPPHPQVPPGWPRAPMGASCPAAGAPRGKVLPFRGRSGALSQNPPVSPRKLRFFCCFFSKLFVFLHGGPVLGPKSTGSVHSAAFARFFGGNKKSPGARPGFALFFLFFWGEKARF